MTKEIPLTKGRVTIVDDEDYDFLMQWKWRLIKGDYAASRLYWIENGASKRKTILMHRLVNKTPKNMQTDHVNNNTLDNRRRNLRTCTLQQNTKNRTKQKNKTSSQYKGVHLYRPTGKWAAQIRIDKKARFLGYYASEHDAALAYNFAAIEHFKEFSNLNKASA